MERVSTLIFFLLCILISGSYGQARSDGFFSESLLISGDDNDSGEGSFIKIKKIMGGINNLPSLKTDHSFYFQEIFEKISFEEPSFFLVFAYRAPPVNL